MKYISLCDGIGAAHVAWHPLGWECLATSEINERCNAVVDYHWGFQNYGDMCNVKTLERIAENNPDLIIGGTPCQSFSTAGTGKREGINSPNGRLIYRFADIVEAAKPRWIIWENVPGSLSANDGEAFAGFVHYLTECGYGVAWRVLDARFFGIPQVRRRVYIVGRIGNWADPAAALFELRCSSRSIATGWANGAQISARKRGHTERDRVRAMNRKASGTLTKSQGQGNETIAHAVIDYHPIKKRRWIRCLTPIERERLQGFPDDYTLVPYNGKPMSTLVRCEMLGNSMAVSVIRAIGEAIQQIENEQI